MRIYAGSPFPLLDFIWLGSAGAGRGGGGPASSHRPALSSPLIRLRAFAFRVIRFRYASPDIDIRDL